MAEFKGNTVYFKDGKKYLSPIFPKHFYEVTKQADIDFLESKGHERVGEVEPVESPSKDVKVVTEIKPQSESKPQADASSDDFGLDKLTFKELKEKAISLGWVQSGSASKKNLIAWLKEQLD